MWLINATTLKLHQFFGSNIPEYSILSHTWEDEEITFQELALPSSRVIRKKGYIKVKETCLRALDHGVQYAWIDTCCIDKTSSAELTESINSMFQWYKNAANCYVYLSDFPLGIRAQDGLATCRWFTRGWTLQELIAPKEVQFYDREWQYIGSKTHFSETISSITRINAKVLLGHDQFKNYSVATRMSWAAHRKTERTEDLAYCLLGIFDVGMPLIYGEGVRAFRRLQEEIIKSSNDLTIFAWDRGGEQGSAYDLFALSPTGFAQSDGIKPYERLWSDPVFTVTNKGLRLDNFRLLWRIYAKNDDNEQETARYSITLGRRYKGDSRTDFRMQLRKVGPGLFIRDGNLVEEPWPSNDSRTRVPIVQFYILTEISDSYAFEHRNRYRSVHFTRDDKIEIRNVIPESHWDDTSQMFFAPLEDYTLVLATSCLVALGASKLQVVVCINFSTDDPFCKIFDAKKYSQHTLWLFRYVRLGHDVTWNDVEADKPEILDFTNQIEIYADGITTIISVSLEIGVIESIAQEDIYSLHFRFETIYKQNEVPPLPSPEGYKEHAAQDAGSSSK
jgi:hypothetical protein